MFEVWKFQECELSRSIPNCDTKPRQIVLGRFGHPIPSIPHCFEVLDDLELRLEEEVGLPASHSDPWHILRPQQKLAQLNTFVCRVSNIDMEHFARKSHVSRFEWVRWKVASCSDRYEPGYRAHFKHTDCEAEDLVPNDRYITAADFNLPRKFFSRWARRIGIGQMHLTFVSVGILLRHCWWIAFHIRQSTHQQETRYEGNQSLASWTDRRSWGTDLAFGLLELYSPMSAFQCVRRWPCSKLECVLLAIQEWYCCEAVVYVGKGQGMIFNKSESRHIQTIESVGGSSDVLWLCSPCKSF